MPDEFHVSLAPRLTEVRKLSRMVEEFGDSQGLPEPIVFVINLALDELITNAVTHGFTGVTEPRIDIGLRVDGLTLVLTIEDNGHPFDPTADSHPDLDSPLEAREIGGLGLHLVKTFASRVDYRYLDGRNCLTLEHDLEQESGSAAG